MLMLNNVNNNWCILKTMQLFYLQYCNIKYVIVCFSFLHLKLIDRATNFMQ